MKSIFTLSATSPSSATTVAPTGAEVAGLDSFDWFVLDARLQGATGGTLDVYLQRFVERQGAAGEWWDWVHFPQLAAGAVAVRYTFDSRMAASAVTTVGQGSSPALAASTMAATHPGARIRLLFVAGASTSAGVAQTIQLTALRNRS